MPLVVPGINSSFGDKSEWVNKLMGKKLTDSTTDATVCISISSRRLGFVLDLLTPFVLYIVLCKEGSPPDAQGG